MVLTVTCIALLIGMCLTLVRAFLGPSVFDRILAVNTFGTKTVLFLGVYGFVTNRPDFLDIALVYTLINFISTLAVLKYYEAGSLSSEESGGHP